MAVGLIPTVFRNPLIRLFAGAALISLSPVWVTLVEVSATTSAFYRFLIGGIALVAVIAFTGRRFDLSKRAWSVLIAAAIFIALDLWLWHRSILYIGPGLSTLLANFQVFIMMIAGFVMLREAPTKMQLVAVPLALLGLGLIVGTDWSQLPDNYRLGVILGLLTAVTYAGYLLSLRASRDDSQHKLPTREVAVVSLVGAAIMGVTALIEGQSLVVPTMTDAGWLLAYGILSHCMGWLLIASSLAHVTTTQAGLALLLQPSLSYVWDVLFFARPMTMRELVGASIALVAIYLGSRPKKNL